MGKPVSIGQSHALISTLSNNINWEDLDGEIIQQIIKNPTSSGKRITQFIKNGCYSDSIYTNSIPLGSVVDFEGTRWSVEEQDKRSLEISSIRLDQITLEWIFPNSPYIAYEDWISQLKYQKPVRLDIRLYNFFKDNPDFIPYSWGRPIGPQSIDILFGGTILKDSGSEIYIPYMGRHYEKWSF